MHKSMQAITGAATYREHVGAATTLRVSQCAALLKRGGGVKAEAMRDCQVQHSTAAASRVPRLQRAGAGVSHGGSPLLQEGGAGVRVHVHCLNVAVQAKAGLPRGREHREG
jgi:hypothetical protein